MYYLGIDGGATKTVYALADKDGKIIRTATGLPCNPFDLGIEESEKRLTDGINEITDGFERSSVKMFAGLSGGVSGDMKDRLHVFFGEFGFAAFENGSDMDNAVETALGSEDGICVIVGTGNVIIAQKNGEKRRFGGYGYYFDDTLCGYDLGRLAIAHTLRVCEGSEKPGKMSELIMNQCPANPLSCLQDFYAKGKSYIASFAPMVFDALPFRDPAAEEIVETQCQKLVGYVNRATACMGFDNRTRLVFIGGLCRHSTALNQCLGLKMHLQPEYTNAGQETGAVRLAMKL